MLICASKQTNQQDASQHHYLVAIAAHCTLRTSQLALGILEQTVLHCLQVRSCSANCRSSELGCDAFIDQ